MSWPPEKLNIILQRYLISRGGKVYPGVPTHASTTEQTADDHHAESHAATHQNTGGDEISVAALSGLLADDQHVLDAEAIAAAVQSGAITDGVTKAPTHDAVYDVKATADAAQTAAEVDADIATHTAIAAAHHAQSHAPTHKDGGNDELDVEELATAGAEDTVPTSDGAGALVMSVPAGFTERWGDRYFQIVNDLAHFTATVTGTGTAVTYPFLARLRSGTTQSSTAKLSTLYWVRQSNGVMVSAIDWSKPIEVLFVGSFVTQYGSVGGLAVTWKFAQENGTGILSQEGFGIRWDRNTTIVTAESHDGTARETSSMGALAPTNSLIRIRIVLDPGVSVKFYMDDVLKATHTTRVPTGTSSATYITVGTENPSSATNVGTDIATIAVSHSDGEVSMGTVTHAETTGQSADDHHAQLHAAAHQNTGGDEINVADLSGLLADDQHVLDAEVIAAIEAEATLVLSGTLEVQGAISSTRITKRVSTEASAAEPTINTDNVEFHSVTAQAEAITSFTTNLSGTPTEAQTLWIAITGTAARAITWGASFEASTVALPTTTVTTARLDVGFVFNTVTSKWRCVASV